MRLSSEFGPPLFAARVALANDAAWAQRAPVGLVNVNGALYFKVSVHLGIYSRDVGLWRSDGITNGTVSLASLDPHEMPFVGVLLFLAGGELWLKDGTSEGTVMVNDINPDGTSDPQSLTPSGVLMYFSAYDGQHRRELWVSDSTADGTRMVRDIVPGPFVSKPYPLLAVPSVGVAFAANDPEKGNELFISDGTEAGTMLADDVAPGTPSSDAQQLALAGSTSFSVASDGVTGSELWAMDLGSFTPGAAAVADAVGVKNRYISFSGGEPGQMQAVRVKFADLAPLLDDLKGQTMWVGEPRDVAEQFSLSDGIPPTVKMAESHFTRHHMDWSTVGVVHVYGENVVPPSVFDVQVIGEGCFVDGDPNYSPPLAISTGRWGDVAGPFDVEQRKWTLPDDDVGMIPDVIAIIDKFGNRPGEPLKVLADLEPSLPDQKINISEVVQ